MTVSKQRKTSARTRLKSVAYADKVTAIENMLRVLKSEQYRLLTDFMYLSPEDLEVYIDLTPRGEYVLTVKAITDRLIDVGKMLD